MKIELSKIETNDPVSIFNFLLDSDRRKQFTQYLVLQFCPENLFFWDATQELKSLCDDNMKRVMVMEIYKKYLAPDAPYEVNISSNSKLLISSRIAIEDVDDDIFNPAIYDIEDMIIYHSYPNFRRAQKDPNLPASLTRTCSRSAGTNV